jgi:hypothetical protein
MRWGAGVVLVIVIVYFIAHVGAFMSSPLGQALSKAAGAAAAVLAALASLPTWLLIGLGAAYLMGPAILKMAGSAVRELGAAAGKGNEAARAKKAAGASDTEVEAYAGGVATESIELIRTKQARAAGSDADTAQRLTQAQQSSAAARAAVAGDPARQVADEEGREDARSEIPVE